MAYSAAVVQTVQEAISLVGIDFKEYHFQLTRRPGPPEAWGRVVLRRTSAAKGCSGDSPESSPSLSCHLHGLKASVRGV